ncbi:hypothetical protein ACFL3T_01130 [Patescibacteria group bacterium]
MTQRHIIGQTGPHRRIDLSEIDEDTPYEQILDEHQDLLEQVEIRTEEARKIEQDRSLIPLHKRTQLESVQRMINRIADEIKTKQSAVLRRQSNTKQTFPGEILNPRQSQRISQDILSEADQEFQRKLASLNVIQLRLDKVANKVETLLSEI